MIEFNYETDFKLEYEDRIQSWIADCIETYGFKEGELNYIFCDDDYLLKLNVEFLDHDTLTDIISFDYTMGKLISGDIFISVERVRENAKIFDQSLENEISRVMVHGILHFMGFKDKSPKDKEVMRAEEDKCIEMLNAS
ncbi:MAG: rRNA maturation RNase YbeY [Bacteroidetes bacterium HGW-Bacteroidetes-18]|nr:MAG: rRNA maturation RNase YbeY [Bacteroidetes bacterium HGW-Bacteroidetes-18]